ncbi:MAG TPA: hypothetical protein VH231_00175 [Solirubrobacteraceae bacterium]|jgi:hypothetical protein|nr:hypothetical protein [Solirubrobacteraceae bacterium]
MIQLSVDKFDTAIDDQKDQLKPPLPPGTFVDRTTMRMWLTASWPLNGQDALNWTSQWAPKSCSIPTGGAATCTGSSVSPFDVPRKTTGLSFPVLGVYRADLSEPDKPGPHTFFKRAAMRSAPCDTSASGRSCKENPASINCSDIRNNYTGQMLLWRQVTPGDYWWP